MMEELSDEDGLEWVGGEVSSLAPAAQPGAPGNVTLFVYALGFLLMIVALADQAAQMWGR